MKLDITKTYKTILGNPPFVKTKSGNLFIDFMLDNLEDFLIDYPFTIKYYQKIFSMFKINKIISYNKYNDLNNKINLNNS